MRRTVVGGLLIACLLATTALSADARITADAGAVRRIAPPASVVRRSATDATAPASDTRFWGFPEAQDLPLEADLVVDIAVTGGRTFRALPGVPGTIDALTVVRSHLVHAQRPRGSRGSVTLLGTLTFDQPILGLVLTGARLDAAGALVAEGTRYPRPGDATRGLELGATGDRITVSADRRRLTLRLRVAAQLDQLRVITASPYACDPAATGTSGADAINLNTPEDYPDQGAVPGGVVMCGLGGDDLLIGGPGPDVILGGSGSDQIQDRAGDDLDSGGPGNDLLYPHGGDDRVIGGTGRDEAYYDGTPVFDDPAPVRVDLGRGRMTGTARSGAGYADHPQFGRDTLAGVEAAWGTNRDDVLLGGPGNDDLFGRGGGDLLRGGPGDDALHGDDPYCYDDANTAPQTDPCAGDNPNGADRLYGEAGDDSLLGGLGDDLLDGGPGDDLASYDARSDPLARPATVDLRLTAAQDTGHGSDRLRSVEGVMGSQGDDTLTGTSGRNTLIGGPGGDTLTALGGADTLIGGYPDAYYGPPRSLAPTEDGADTLDAGAGDDTLITTNAEGVDDALLGGPGAFDACRSVGTDSLSGCELTDVLPAALLRRMSRPRADRSAPGVGRGRAARAVTTGEGPTPAAADFGFDPADVRRLVGEWDPLVRQYQRYQFVITVYKSKVIARFDVPQEQAAKRLCGQLKAFAGRPFTIDMGAPLSDCQASVVHFWNSYWSRQFDLAATRRVCVAGTWSRSWGFFRLDPVRAPGCALR